MNKTSRKTQFQWELLICRFDYCIKMLTENEIEIFVYGILYTNVQTHMYPLT